MELESPMNLTAVYIKVPEGYVAFVEELPGANTQGETLEEARDNLQEAVTLVLEANRELAERSLVGQQFTREPVRAGRPMKLHDLIRHLESHGCLPAPRPGKAQRLCQP